ncbi:hypothetical protein [Cupriavidus necator]
MEQDHATQHAACVADDFDCALTREAILWMAQLPDRARPYELGCQFPHIANTIAQTWGSIIGRCFLSGLLSGERALQRFLIGILQEISILRDYVDSRYRQDIWLRAFDAQQRPVN